MTAERLGIVVELGFDWSIVVYSDGSMRICADAKGINVLDPGVPIRTFLTVLERAAFDSQNRIIGRRDVFDEPEHEADLT